MPPKTARSTLVFDWIYRFFKTATYGSLGQCTSEQYCQLSRKHPTRYYHTFAVCSSSSANFVHFQRQALFRRLMFQQTTPSFGFLLLLCLQTERKESTRISLAMVQVSYLRKTPMSKSIQTALVYRRVSCSCLASTSSSSAILPLSGQGLLWLNQE